MLAFHLPAVQKRVQGEMVRTKLGTENKLLLKDMDVRVLDVGEGITLQWNQC
ncbi:hypothetical protein PILCRDRAFT_810616 [Piloderma croceum F 1598]|uniref:Uncharacterized protein n=1 Tax=Piloderma croceum (strain F 1598) TaxID=765440 RepID=A0A0C3GI67_PILCF|nr:hypothetical protein PILCRDRAFT_810616 [Piloderma croceum F 1598]